MKRSSLWLLPLALALGACAGNPGSGDAATDAPTAEAGGDGASSSDSASGPEGGSDGGSGSDGGGGDAACNPSSTGALQRNYYCDLASIHVLQFDDASPRVQVAARLGTGAPGSPSCGVVDGIDVFQGSTMVQSIATSRAFVPGNTGSLLADEAAASALPNLCAEERTRLTGYGLVLRGRDGNGPFEARCGTAASGSRWPPGTFLACHRNLEQAPVGVQQGNFSVMRFGTHSAVMGYFTLSHAAGRPALATVQSALRVVSPTDMPLSSTMPLVGGDTTGWMASVSETGGSAGAVTQVQFNALDANPLGSALCPPPATPPNPPASMPFFLARIQGTSARGNVTLEALANCMGSN